MEDGTWQRTHDREYMRAAVSATCQKILRRSRADADINGGFYLVSLVSLRRCLCVSNRHIQANKVSLAPCGDSKQ